MREYTPERVAEITGLTPDQLYRTAALYAGARAAFIAWTMGVNHSTKGTETVNAINNLALITGNIGRAGRGALLDHRPVQRHGHARGRRSPRACRAIASSRARRIAPSSPRSGTFRSSASRAPRGLAYPDIIEAALDRPDPRAVDHRHQSDRLVSQSRRAAAGARGARLPRRPGRLPSHADVGARATSCCRRRSGVKRRAPTPTPSAASAKSTAPSIRRATRAPTSTSFSTWRRRSACATSSFRAGDAARRLRGVEARVGRAGSATTRA